MGQTSQHQRRRAKRMATFATAVSKYTLNACTDIDESTDGYSATTLNKHPFGSTVSPGMVTHLTQSCFEPTDNRGVKHIDDSVCSSHLGGLCVELYVCKQSSRGVDGVSSGIT